MGANTGSQHPDHVQTQSSKIAAEIMPILKDARMGTVMNSTIGENGDMIGSGYGYTGIINVEELTEKLVAYIMAYQERDWYSGWKTGFQAAKEGKSLKDEEARLQMPDGHAAK